MCSNRFFLGLGLYDFNLCVYLLISTNKKIQKIFLTAQLLLFEKSEEWLSRDRYMVTISSLLVVDYYRPPNMAGPRPSQMKHSF